MKNYWLARRKKRELAKIADIVEKVINKLAWIKALRGVMFPWQPKVKQP